MARRRINFDEVDVNPNATVESVMPSNSNQATVTDKDGQMITLTRDEAKRKKLNDYQNINTNQTDVVRGSIKMDFLLKDLKLIHKYFLSTFDSISTKVDLCGDNPDIDPEYILFTDFPLPDYCRSSDGKMTYTPDKEDIIMIINNYPKFGPHGIHIKEDSPNREKIEKALEGHQYDEAIGEPNLENVGDLSRLGWRWVCFHYKSNQWSFNRNQLTQGDCLAKYIDNLYAALSGSAASYHE